ncbi:MAG TPA: leucyl aminopeptidase family protein, partial [Rhizobiaceae bacterium]|nr:leucyl aminopeptidase family protein [Rhizobiaceae bacterium]
MTLTSISSLKSGGKPVHLCASAPDPDRVGARVARFAAEAGFDGSRPSILLVPDEKGGIECALAGAGGADRNPMDAGRLARQLPAGDWRLEGDVVNPALAALAFALASYSFDRYRKKKEQKARLVLPDGVDGEALQRQAKAVFLARDLINTPTNDMGPAELEEAIRKVGASFKAEVQSVIGDELLTRNFPMVHAVGRASASAPRIVDLQWGNPSHPRVTLVGKGVCFDSGGLNVKPGDSMTLMKKDMGGAASTLALAQMIMAAKLPVRLRLIVPAVENAISGNAFRPGDVLQSRKGITVEIGNTDAEGRLILGDALAWGDEEAPALMIDMATLTGAARVALGLDLPGMFTDDDALAGELHGASRMVCDPLWRLPLWAGYKKGLSSEVADISHIGKGPFGGAITAALFLQRFVEKAGSWAHFDLYA